MIPWCIRSIYLVFRSECISLTYLVFIQGLWLTAPKSLGIFWVIRGMGASFVIIFCPLKQLLQSHKVKQVSCYSRQLDINLVTFGKHLWMGAGRQANIPRIKAWIYSHLLMSGEGEKGWGTKAVTNGQWFNQSYLYNEAFKRMRFREFWGWWTRGDLRGASYSHRAWKICILFPILALDISSI